MKDWRLYMLGIVLLVGVVVVLLRWPQEGPDRAAPPPRAAAADARPVVLITIDTLRADHVGWAGHFADTSPKMDAFAGAATVFTNAWSASGTTTPSHLSLMTGLHPHQHGVLGNRDVASTPFRSVEGIRTAAEVLAADGYATGGFVSAGPVKRKTGLATGFQAWTEPDKASWACDRTAEAAVSWLEGLDREGFFLWVHLWEPHTPNHPTAHLDRFAGDEGYEALLEARRVHPRAVRRRTSRRMLDRFMPASGAVPVSRAMLAGLLARYDADVRTVDGCVDQVLEALRERDSWRDAVVAITADHGQSLGQHGWLGHNSTRPPVLRVPLVIKTPADTRAPARVDSVAAGVDVMPTLLAPLDTPGAAQLLEQAAGRDLLADPGAPGEALAVDRNAQGTLVAGRWKLSRPGRRAPSLYDMETDPQQYLDVAGRHPELVDRLTRRLDALLADRPRETPAAAREPDAGLLQELEALGYLE